MFQTSLGYKLPQKENNRTRKQLQQNHSSTLLYLLDIFIYIVDFYYITEKKKTTMKATNSLKNFHS
jgi:hypothetical protein